MIKNLQLRLAETGKIKIGKKGDERTSKKGTKYRLPEKTEYFTITTLERDKNGDFLPDTEIMDLYGKKPTNLDIKLLFDDIELNFPTQYAYYQGSKRLCSGDGEKAQQVNWQTGEVTDIECNPDKCPHFQKGECKVGGILNCILTKSARIGGVYKFRTHSINSVINILSSLKFIWTITGGKLAMIPLTLTLRPKHVTPEKAKAGITVYVANIEYHGNNSGLLDDALEVAKGMLARNADMKQIQMKAKELAFSDGLTAEEIAAEFYPQSQDGYEDTEIKQAEFTEMMEAGSTIEPLKDEEMPEPAKPAVKLVAKPKPKPKKPITIEQLHKDVYSAYNELMKLLPSEYTDENIFALNDSYLEVKKVRDCKDVDKLPALLSMLRDTINQYNAETNQNEGELQGEL